MSSSVTVLAAMPEPSPSVTVLAAMPEPLPSVGIRFRPASFHRRAVRACVSSSTATCLSSSTRRFRTASTISMDSGGGL
jgi:hypothetical protein